MISRQKFCGFKPAIVSLVLWAALLSGSQAESFRFEGYSVYNERGSAQKTNWFVINSTSNAWAISVTGTLGAPPAVLFSDLTNVYNLAPNVYGSSQFGPTKGEWNAVGGVAPGAAPGGNGHVQGIWYLLFHSFHQPEAEQIPDLESLFFFQRDRFVTERRSEGFPSKGSSSKLLREVSGSKFQLMDHFEIKETAEVGNRVAPVRATRHLISSANKTQRNYELVVTNVQRNNDPIVGPALSGLTKINDYRLANALEPVQYTSAEWYSVEEALAIPVIAAEAKNMMRLSQGRGVPAHQAHGLLLMFICFAAVMLAGLIYIVKRRWGHLSKAA